MDDRAAQEKATLPLTRKETQKLRRKNIFQNKYLHSIVLHSLHPLAIEVANLLVEDAQKSPAVLTGSEISGRLEAAKRKARNKLKRQRKAAK